MKCINCGTYLENKPSFCPNCGNKVSNNKTFYIRIIILGIVATVLPLLFLRDSRGIVVYLCVFGFYAICSIIVELTLKVNTRKEAIKSSIFALLLQGVLMSIITIIDESYISETAAALPVIIILLELPYLFILFIISIVAYLIFGKIKKES